MKKIILASFFSVAVASLVNAQSTFGIHIDGVSSNMEYKTSGLTMKPDSKLGWKVGTVANFSLASTFSFMPQLNLVSKGAKMTYNGTTTTNNLTYVELPLNFVYTSGGFFGGVGPNIAFGVGGKEKQTGEQDVTVKFDGKANGSDANVHLKALDFGGQAIAGYKLSSGLFFNAHYNLGFSNISPDNGVTVKNNYFGFGIGYFFGGTPKASK
ncbi:MAG: outer membrane beta-barrel protein [Flavisolibacter sp.]